MGAHQWYFFPYQPDIQKALDALREREFRAGRYNPAMDFPEFPINGDEPGPGAKHTSIEAAIEASEADGTRSILDMTRVGTAPDYCVVTPLPSRMTLALYGTDRPTKDMVVMNMDFFKDLKRGQGAYMVLYQSDQPSEILFAGYSFD